MIKVLIVDDEKPICDLADMSLTAAGYHCRVVQNGVSTLEIIESGSFNLIFLNVMPPGVNGYDIMEYIRPLEIPVVFITTKHGVRDRVRDLRLRTDGYLIRPFGMVELTTRVEAVLRRYSKTERPLRAGDVTVGVEVRMITRAGGPVVLTSKEFRLLLLFIRDKDVTLFRETLYKRVWEGECPGDGRTLDLRAQELRRKLGWENSLAAVYRVGYHLGVPQ